MVGNPNHDERGRFASGVAGAVKGAAKGAGLLLDRVHSVTALGLGATHQAVLDAANWGATGAAVGAIVGLASHKKNVKNHIVTQHKKG